MKQRIEVEDEPEECKGRRYFNIQRVLISNQDMINSLTLRQNEIPNQRKCINNICN